MIRHGMVEPIAADAPSPATDSPAPKPIPDAGMRLSGSVPDRQCRVKAQRSDLPEFAAALPIGGCATADIGRNSKSP